MGEGGEESDFEGSEGENSGETSRFLTFNLCGEKYGIPLLKVKEVIEMPKITPIPNAPHYFKGITNLRGQVLSIVDLRVRFKMSKAEIHPHTPIIILDLDSVSIGVIVDSIHSVMAVPTSEIQPPPEVESQINNSWILGVIRSNAEMFLLLDVGNTLNSEDLGIFQSKEPVASIATLERKAI